MNTYWQEVVCMSCPVDTIPFLRCLDRNTKVMCDQRIDVLLLGAQIRAVRRVFTAWRENCKYTRPRPRQNSWKRKIRHPDDKLLMPIWDTL